MHLFLLLQLRQLLQQLKIKQIINHLLGEKDLELRGQAAILAGTKKPEEVEEANPEDVVEQTFAHYYDEIQSSPTLDQESKQIAEKAGKR